jgi:hypothetical protein
MSEYRTFSPYRIVYQGRDERPVYRVRSRFLRRFSVLIAESPWISFRIYIVSHNSDFTASSSCRKLSTELWP